MKPTYPIIEKIELDLILKRKANLYLIDNDVEAYKNTLYDAIDFVLSEIDKVEQKGYPEFLIKTVEQCREVFTATRHLLTINKRLSNEQIDSLTYFYKNLLRGFKC